jgi:hypothetical protein
LSDSLTVSRRFQRQPSRVFDFLWLHRVRPRVAKTESSREFLGGNLCGCFDNRSERIAQLTGIFPVCMIDAPKLISLLWDQDWFRVHALIEHGAALRQVPNAHFLLRIRSKVCDGS